MLGNLYEFFCWYINSTVPQMNRRVNESHCSWPLHFIPYLMACFLNEQSHHLLILYLRSTLSSSSWGLNQTTVWDTSFYFLMQLLWFLVVLILVRFFFLINPGTVGYFTQLMVSPYFIENLTLSPFSNLILLWFCSAVSSCSSTLWKQASTCHCSCHLCFIYSPSCIH